MSDSTPTNKQLFLESYEREFATTMKVLHAYPEDRLDLQPHARLRTARDLAWIFAQERGLGMVVMNDGFASMDPSQGPPPAPESWSDQLAAFEKAHHDLGDMLRAMPDEKLTENVKFMTGPQTIGDVRRIDFLWFMLSDQIHHRGQFSVYLRMADGKVPSIYGPSSDEPWM